MLPDAPAVQRIVFTDLRMPWEALGAQGVPAEFLTASNEVQLALAMLVGQHRGIPTVLDVDEQGHLGFNIVEIAGRALTLGEQSQATSLPVTMALDQGPPPKWSVMGNSTPAVGGQAVVLIVPGAGISVHVDMILAKFENRGAAGMQAAVFSIVDGATTVFQHTMVVSGTAGDKDQLLLMGARIGQILGGANISIGFNGGVANCAESVNVGADFASY